MRVTSMVAGLAIALAACGGEKKAPESTTTTGAPDTAAAPAAAPAAPAGGGGANHDVNMTLTGSKYQFEPAELTIKAGDQITFHNKSGGPHNVSFWEDSIPAAAKPILKDLPDAMGPFQGPLLTEEGKTYTVKFTGAPAGVYKFYCLPHLALGMHGKITVQ